MKTNKTNSFRTELDHYLEEDVLPDNSQFDILLWWKLNGVKYPVLQTIARDILAIPVSNVVRPEKFQFMEKWKNRNFDYKIIISVKNP